MMKQIKNQYGTFNLHDMVAVMIDGEVQGVGTIEKINDAKDKELVTVETKLHYFISHDVYIYWKDKESANLTVCYYEITSVKSFMDEVKEDARELQRQVNTKRQLVKKLQNIMDGKPGEEE